MVVSVLPMLEKAVASCRPFSQVKLQRVSPLKVADGVAAYNGS